MDVLKRSPPNTSQVWDGMGCKQVILLSGEGGISMVKWMEAVDEDDDDAEAEGTDNRTSFCSHGKVARS